MEELLIYCHSVPNSALSCLCDTGAGQGTHSSLLCRQRVLQGHCQKGPSLFLPPPPAVGAAPPGGGGLGAFMHHSPKGGGQVKLLSYPPPGGGSICLCHSASLCMSLLHPQLSPLTEGTPSDYPCGFRVLTGL